MNRDAQPTPPRSSDPLSLASTIDLLDLFWRRKGVVALGMVFAGLIGVFYYLFIPPKYFAMADVLLVQKRPEVITRDRQYETSFGDYVATHRAVIVSPMIVRRAVELSNLHSLKTFAEYDPDWDLSGIIIEDLAVKAGQRDLGENADSIMTLSYRGPVEDECSVVVQAVLDSYMEFLDEIHRDMSDDTVRLISEARDLLEHNLQRQEDDYVHFREASPLVSRGTDEVNPLQARLEAIEMQRTELLIRRTEIEGQLKSIQNAKSKNINDRDLLALVTDIRKQQTTDTTTANVSTAIDSQILQLADREQELLEHFGPNHPRVATIRQRIAAARKLLALPSTAYIQDSGDPSGGSETSDADAVAIYMQSLEQELDRTKMSEELLSKLYREEHETAKELSGYQLKDEGYRRGIDRTQQLYDGIISQLQEASLVKGYGGFQARVIAEPLWAEQVVPSLKLTVAGVLLGGLFLGFVGALFADMMDKSFHSRVEIQTRMGAPVLGEIPSYDPADDNDRKRLDSGLILDPMLCTRFQHRSPQSEAYRSLRATLMIHQRSSAYRIILVTSPSPGDGKSTVAANLAISIAQLAQRVLLIDADSYRPRQHEIFGVAEEPGLGSMVTSAELLGDAVQPTTVDGLWLLPAGSETTDRSELLTSDRFRDLLTAVRTEYDYVLIDSEPLLATSAPCVIAAQVDGVLLALRPTRDARVRAGLAKTILDASDIRPIGIVVNGIGGAGARGYRNESVAYLPHDVSPAKRI